MPANVLVQKWHIILGLICRVCKAEWDDVLPRGDSRMSFGAEARHGCSRLLMQCSHEISL
jgi:hypothetical protein